MIGYTTLEVLGFKVNPVTGRLERTLAIEYLEDFIPYRQPCQAALQRIVAEDPPVVTSSEVVQEILYRYLSLKRPHEAVQVAGDFWSRTP